MEKECGKSYKQKSGIVRHLKNMHKGKLFATAKFKILDRDEMEYETKASYVHEHEEKDLAADEVSWLVEAYGEEVYIK